MTLPENSTSAPSSRVGEQLRALLHHLDWLVNSAPYRAPEVLCNDVLGIRERVASIVRERDGTARVEPVPPVEGYRLRVILQMPDKRVFYFCNDDIPDEERLAEEIGAAMATAKDPEVYFPIDTFSGRVQDMLREEFRLKYLGFGNWLEVDNATAN